MIKNYTSTVEISREQIREYLKDIAQIFTNKESIAIIDAILAALDRKWPSVGKSDLVELGLMITSQWDLKPDSKESTPIRIIIINWLREKNLEVSDD